LVTAQKLTVFLSAPRANGARRHMATIATNRANLVIVATSEVYEAKGQELALSPRGLNSR
jgi:hypothetical protein